jgi:hypothetical protein
MMLRRDGMSRAEADKWLADFHAVTTRTIRTRVAKGEMQLAGVDRTIAGALGIPVARRGEFMTALRHRMRPPMVSGSTGKKKPAQSPNERTFAKSIAKRRNKTGYRWD